MRDNDPLMVGQPWSRDKGDASLRQGTICTGGGVSAGVCSSCRAFRRHNDHSLLLDLMADHRAAVRSLLPAAIHRIAQINVDINLGAPPAPR